MPAGYLAKYAAPNTTTYGTARFRETYLTREGKEASHIPAWDFTMSAPKSWSVAAIVGQDTRLLRAAEIANRKALDVAEYYTQARGGGNAPLITARKWIVATFRHDTARPVDGYPAPNLHFHNLIMNLVRTGDRFRSMQTAELYRISSLMTQVFRDELLRQGRALGYDMQVDTTTGAPEIKGFTKEYLDAESLRSANIKAELEKRGFTGARAAQIIARQGREEKLDLPADELRALHQAHGSAFGDQARIAKDEALKRGPVEPKRQITAEAAVDYAYAMTSNSLQSKTVERNIWNVEAGDPRVSKLLHKTAAYVGPSRPEYDLQVVTDNMERLVPALSQEMEVTKALSLEEIQSFRKSVGKELHIDEYQGKEHELTPELSLEAS